MNPYQTGLAAQRAYPPFAAGARFFMSATVTVWVDTDPEDGQLIFGFAGTRNARDFVDDVLALPVEIPGIGHVHSGFNEGSADMFENNLRPLLGSGQRFKAIGHSLGVPHAAIFVARVCSSISDCRCSYLGGIEPPRTGFTDFNKTITAYCDAIFLTRNARDPVVSLPEHIPPLFPYEHFAPLIELNSPSSSLDPFADHMLEQCLIGLKALA